MGWGLDHVDVVEDERDIVPVLGNVVDEGRQNCLDPRRAGRFEQREGICANPRPDPSTAAITYAQKSPGSLSPGSSEIHPAGVSLPGVAASHSASRVVLPNPAGAVTRVSLRSAPCRNWAISRGRETRPGPPFGHVQLGGEKCQSGNRLIWHATHGRIMLQGRAPRPAAPTSIRSCSHNMRTYLANPAKNRQAPI